MSFNTHQTFLMNHFMQFGSEKDFDVEAEIAEILSLWTRLWISLK